MRFDWKRFCDEKRIPYVTRGANTAKGNISIKCPFCGSSDESEHMGLSLEVNRPYWGCWRSSSHKGRHPAKLIVNLLKCSYNEAFAMVDSQLENPDDYERSMEKLMEVEPEEEEKEQRRLPLLMPQEFRAFEQYKPHTFQSLFEKYLMARGFPGESCYRAIKRYGLRWAVTGEYAYRIIVPVYHEGLMVTWTARAIGPATIRYKTLEREKEIRDIKDCLLLPPDTLNIKRKCLVITEGPFDAIKFDTFASSYSITTVCVFGLQFTTPQLELLSKMRGRFQRIVLLLDLDAKAASSIMASQVSEVLGEKAESKNLPAGVKDPGDLTSFQVKRLAQQFTGE